MRDVRQSLPRDVRQSLPRVVRQSLPRHVRQSLPRDVRQSLPRDVRQSLPRVVRQSLPRLNRLLPLLLPIAELACGPQTTDVVVHLPGSQTSPTIADPTPSGASAPEPAAPAGAITWETDDAVARERAKTRGAPLLVFLCADWSAPVTRMDRETWTDPRVIRRARSFVALRLDVSEADANAQADADRYDLQRVPSTLFLDELGHEITRIDGYAGPDDMLAAMGRVMPAN